MASRLQWFIISVLICVSLSTARDVGREYVALRQQIGKGHYAEALVECKRLIREYPDFSFFYETLPEVALYSGKSTEAIDFFYERIEDGTQLPLVYYGLGTTYYLGKDYSGAVACFGYAIESGCDLADCFRAYEYAYEKLFGADAAIQHFNSLCRKNTTNGNLWYALALAHWAKGDLRNALQCVDRALDSRATSRRFLQSKAALTYLLTQRDSEVPLIEELLQVADAELDFSGSAFLRSHLILGIGERHRHDLILFHTIAIVRTGGLYGFVRWKGWGHKLLADVFQAEGNLSEARKEADTSIAAAMVAHDDDLLFAGMQKQFDICSEQGEYYAALENACDRLRISNAIGEELRSTRALCDLAWALHNLGISDLALSFAIEAQNKALAFEGNFGLRATIDLVLGTIYEGLSNYSEALKSYKHAISGFPDKGNWDPMLLKQNERFGRVLAKLGNFQEAERFLLRQINWQRSFGYPKELSSSDLNLGLILMEVGQYQRARAYLVEALEISRQIGQRPIVLSAARALSRWEVRYGKDSSALAYLERAIVAGQKMGLFGERLPSGTGPQVDFINDCEEVIALRTNCRRIKDALSLSEYLKRMSTDRIMSVVFDEGHRTSNHELIKRFTALREEWQLFQTEKATEVISQLQHRKAIDNLVLQAKVLRTELECSKLLDTMSLDRQEPPYPGIGADSANQVTGQWDLPKSKAILEYSVGDNRTTCFVITQKGVDAFTIPITRDSLRALLAQMSSVFRESAGKTAATNPIVANFSFRSLRRGFDVLVRPADSLLSEVRELGIVADGELRNLPFEILIDGTQQGNPSFNGRAGEYLLERYQITYATSIAQVFAKHKNPDAHSKFLLGIGSALGIPAQSPSVYLTEGLTASRFESNVPRYFPGVQEEMEFLTKWMTGKAGTFLKLSSREEFGELANQFSIIHLAAHYSLNEEQPLLSHMDFASDSVKSNPIELRSLDILPLGLNVEMAVLSGCNTARSSGERRPNGYANSFLEAGVHTTIGSLWSVDDKATAALMEGFYTHLGMGESRGMALRSAKLDLIRSGRMDPFYWGAFILTGEDGEIQIPKVREAKRWNYMVATGCFISFCIFVLWWRRRDDLHEV